jgi:hypothetical protein
MGKDAAKSSGKEDLSVSDPPPPGYEERLRKAHIRSQNDLTPEERAWLERQLGHPLRQRPPRPPRGPDGALTD